MDSGDVLRIVLIFLGIYIMGVAILSLAKRKLTEPFCIAWGCFSFILILAGIFIHTEKLSDYISNIMLFIIILASILIIFAAYFVSKQISILARRTQELTMQLSLLIKKNEELTNQIKQQEIK